MTANSRFPCAINPDTGKPFTKHWHVNETVHYRYHNPRLLVNFLALDISESFPVESGTTKRCVRPGCSKNIIDPRRT